MIDDDHDHDYGHYVAQHKVRSKFELFPSDDDTKLELLPGKHVLRVKESPDDPHQLHGRAHVWSSD